jgi:hypothetical protein
MLVAVEVRTNYVSGVGEKEVDIKP